MNFFLYKKFLTDVWKFLWEPVADTRGPQKGWMDTTDNKWKNIQRRQW